MKTDFELSRKIAEIEERIANQAGPEGTAEALEEIFTLVLQSVTDSLELTQLTVPYMLLTLESICGGMRSAMDPMETVQYELMRKLYGNYILSMVVPSTMIKDGASGGKGERDEEKRE